jgi:hypothetical protein
MPGRRYEFVAQESMNTRQLRKNFSEKLATLSWYMRNLVEHFSEKLATLSWMCVHLLLFGARLVIRHSVVEEIKIPKE